MNKAVDFVKKQIDEFEKRIFGRGKSVKTASNGSQKYKSLNGMEKDMKFLELIVLLMDYNQLIIQLILYMVILEKFRLGKLVI